MSRDIELPPVHNVRSPQQWEIISQHVDFGGKTVLDLGCGYGDLMWRCWKAGARSVNGVDKDIDILKSLDEINDQLYLSSNILIWQYNVDEWPNSISGIEVDITLCFSVLPYLNDPAAILCWIRTHSDISLVECQYASDGPGFDWIESDKDMQKWLDNIGWQRVEPIGKTFVEGRDKWRTIWLCE